MSAYDELLTKTKEIGLLGTTSGILTWDMETYMPPRGAEMRGEQLGMISRMIHRMSTSEEFGRLITEAEKKADTTDDMIARNLYLLRKQYDEATRLPEDLVAEISRQRAVTANTWIKAKPKSDWKSFEPHLEKMFELSMKRAEALMELRGISKPYDVVVDDFEPKMISDVISKVFTELRNPLVDMTRRFSEASKSVDQDIVKKRVPIDIQRNVAHEITKLMGYDTTSDQAGGRIDEVLHPFTVGFYDDVRITIRYNEADPVNGVLTILHEAGHALYEQSLKQDWKWQPIGVASSFGVHESISRFYENVIGRSGEFWEYSLPMLNESTNNAFQGVDKIEFVKALNQVRPSKIRITADEVTYSLHIIIRFEIEQDLFAGKIQVSELPEIWNQKYEEYLGLTIDNYAEGVMQDSHWANGNFGYFPSYALGNVYGGMWLETMSTDLPNWREDVGKGDLGSIQKWMMANLMDSSNLYDPGVLIQNATGKELTARPFLSYLDEKYAGLFQ